MTNKFTVDSTGFDKIEEDLRKFAPMIVGKKGYPKNALRNAANTMAKDALAEAQRRAPVSDKGTTIPKSMGGGKIPPGRLKRSLRKKPLSAKYRDQAILAGDSKEYFYIGYLRGKKRFDPLGAWYARIVERGSDKMRARPFLRPAVVGRERILRAEFDGKITRDLDNIAKKLNRESMARLRAKGRL